MTRWRVKIKRADGQDCDHLADEPCSLCEADKARPLSMPAVHSFHVDTYDNMFHPWEKPFEITSREQLRQESIKRGVVSKQLKDSTTFRENPDRWI